MLLSKFLAVLAFLEALELLLSKRYIKSSFSKKRGLRIRIYRQFCRDIGGAERKLS